MASQRVYCPPWEGCDAGSTNPETNAESKARGDRETEARRWTEKSARLARTVGAGTAAAQPLSEAEYDSWIIAIGHQVAEWNRAAAREAQRQQE